MLWFFLSRDRRTISKFPFESQGLAAGALVLKLDSKAAKGGIREVGARVPGKGFGPLAEPPKSDPPGVLGFGSLGSAKGGLRRAPG